MTIYVTTINLLEPRSDHTDLLMSISTSVHFPSSKRFLLLTNPNKCHDLVNQSIELKVSLKTNQTIDNVIHKLTYII